MTSLVEMKFSREAEAQADAEGLRRLVAARINPAGMADFMDTLAQQSSGAKVPEMLSSHPASEDRAKRLREAASAHTGPWDVLALDWAAVHKSLAGSVTPGATP